MEVQQLIFEDVIVEAEERHRAAQDELRSDVQRWFDHLTPRQKDELGAWIESTMQYDALVALSAAGGDWHPILFLRRQLPHVSNHLLKPLGHEEKHTMALVLSLLKSATLHVSPVGPPCTREKSREAAWGTFNEKRLLYKVRPDARWSAFCRPLGRRSPSRLLKFDFEDLRATSLAEQKRGDRSDLCSAQRQTASSQSFRSRFFEFQQPARARRNL